MSTPTPARCRTQVLATRAFLALAVLALAGCDRESRTSSPGGGGSAGRGAGGVTMELTVAEPSGDTRAASAKISASRTLQNVQLSFEVPEGCQIIAGAAVRNIPQITGGTPMGQELTFRCTAGTTGALRARLTSKDEAGAPVETTVEEKF